MAAGCRRISITAAAVVDFRSIHRLFVAPCFAFGTGGRICRFLLCPAARTGGKDTKMRFRKTPQEKRTTYKQLDENNHVIAEVTPDLFTNFTEATGANMTSLSMMIRKRKKRIRP